MMGTARARLGSLRGAAGLGTCPLTAMYRLHAQARLDELRAAAAEAAAEREEEEEGDGEEEPEVTLGDEQMVDVEAEVAAAVAKVGCARVHACMRACVCVWMCVRMCGLEAGVAAAVAMVGLGGGVGRWCKVALPHGEVAAAVSQKAPQNSLVAKVGWGRCARACACSGGVGDTALHGSGVTLKRRKNLGYPKIWWGAPSLLAWPGVRRVLLPPFQTRLRLQGCCKGCTPAHGRCPAPQHGCRWSGARDWFLSACLRYLCAGATHAHFLHPPSPLLPPHAALPRSTCPPNTHTHAHRWSSPSPSP